MSWITSRSCLESFYDFVFRCFLGFKTSPDLLLLVLGWGECRDAVLLRSSWNVLWTWTLDLTFPLQAALLEIESWVTFQIMKDFFSFWWNLSFNLVQICIKSLLLLEQNTDLNDWGHIFISHAEILWSLASWGSDYRKQQGSNGDLKMIGLGIRTWFVGATLGLKK